jgi:hypothetical protein
VCWRVRKEIVLRFVAAVRKKKKKKKKKQCIQSIAVTHVIVCQRVRKEIVLRFVPAVRKEKKKEKAMHSKHCSNPCNCVSACKKRNSVRDLLRN